MAWSARRGRLYAFRDACWHSWAELSRSMEKLSGYPFEWVLPGHGRRFHAPRGDMRERMRECLLGMQAGD